MTLRGTHKKYLRGLAHHLEPVVQMGKEGLSEGVVRAADVALTDHELIKVRLPQVDRTERKALAASLEERTGSDLAGLTGRVAILYRKHPDEPKIRLPR